MAEALEARGASVGLEADLFDLLEGAQQLGDGEVAGMIDGAVCLRSAFGILCRAAIACDT